ncbi:hypothetical protein Tco_0328021 [Tanacetum coccineum]
MSSMTPSFDPKQSRTILGQLGYRYLSSKWKPISGLKKYLTDYHLEALGIAQRLALLMCSVGKFISLQDFKSFAETVSVLMTYNTYSRPLGLDYISLTWAQAQQDNPRPQWTKTKPRSNWLRSGGSKKDEGLLEDTSAAISDLGWPFTPSHKSSPYFATYVGSVLQGLLELSSTCSWLDRSVSGQIGRTRRFHLWKAPTPNGLSRCSHFLADPSCKRCTFSRREEGKLSSRSLLVFPSSRKRMKPGEKEMNTLLRNEASSLFFFKAPSLTSTLLTGSAVEFPLP